MRLSVPHLCSSLTLAVCTPGAPHPACYLVRHVGVVTAQNRFSHPVAVPCCVYSWEDELEPAQVHIVSPCHA